MKDANRDSKQVDDDDRLKPSRPSELKGAAARHSNIEPKAAEQKTDKEPCASQEDQAREKVADAKITKELCPAASGYRQRSQAKATKACRTGRQAPKPEQ